MTNRTKIERVGGHLLVGDYVIPIAKMVVDARSYAYGTPRVCFDDFDVPAEGWTAREILEVAYGGGEWLHHPRPQVGTEKTIADLRATVKVQREEIAELQEQNKSLKGALWSAEHAMIDAVEHLDHGERDEARGLLVDQPKKMVGQIREAAKVGR